MTKPRLDVLVMLDRVGGRVHDPSGSATKQLAGALGYTGSLTGLKRVLVALEENKFIQREPSSGRVHTVELTSKGCELLRERGLSRPQSPTRLIDDVSTASRESLVFAVRATAQRMIEWSQTVDLDKNLAELRIEALATLYQGSAAEMPDPDELAIVVARTRMVLGSLLDSYLAEPDQVDTGTVMAALTAVQDAQRLLMSIHATRTAPSAIRSA